MTTTHTHTATTTKDERDAFNQAHQAYNRMNPATFMGVDLDSAVVAKFDEIVTSTVSDWQAKTTAYTLDTVWAVVAPQNIGRNILRAVGTLGYHTGYCFPTEAAAEAFLVKVRKVKAKEIAKESRLAAAADAARKACHINPAFTTENVLVGTDAAVRLGSLVEFHGMGKRRVGVVVDKTPTKWVLAYTTPSNSGQIREAKVSRI